MPDTAVVKRPPSYELFMSPLLVSAQLDPNALESIQFAYFCSKYGHSKQKRDDGRRYFDHPKEAAWLYINELNGRDARVIIGLLLHDISEDTYLLSPHRISLNFGEDIALDLRALTKLPKGKETVEQYLTRNIERGPYAILGKLCDRVVNVRDLGGCTEEKQKKQVIETETYHLPMLVPALRTHGDIWTEHAKDLEQKLHAAIAQFK